MSTTDADIYAQSIAKVCSADPSTHFPVDSSNVYFGTGDYLLLKYNAVDEVEKFYAIAHVSLCFQAHTNTDCIFSFSPLLDTFNAGTVTYSDKPRADSTAATHTFYAAASGFTVAQSEFTDWATLKQCLLDGMQIGVNADNVRITVDSLLRASDNPRVSITYSSDTTVTPTISNCAPSSGYINKAAANTFSWVIEPSAMCLGDYTQTAATFEWRTGEGATSSSISCGTNLYCTVPANAFSTDSIQWRVTATTDTDETATSDWHTLSTVEPASTAVALSPINALVDSSRAVTFSWEHISSVGTAQTAYDIYCSTDDSTFTAIASGTTADTTAEIAANTLTAGTNYWKVRTYNANGVAGEWSPVVQFVAIAAPPAPPVTIASATPRPTFSWQSSEQQGYQYEIDGSYISDVIFGTGKTVKCPTFLSDGQHTVKVRVCNKYGLWSAWGAVGFTVANTAGDAITLSVGCNHVAALEWTTTGTYTKYYVYRDDQPIAKTTGTAYTDNLINGEANYFIVGAYDNSDCYGKSNHVSVTLSVDTVMIADTDTWAWQALRLSDTNARATGLSQSRQITTTYYAGARYPSAELSEFYSKSITFTAAFKTTSEIAALEALLGKIVCIKTKNGDCVIGVLSDIAKTVGQMYTAFSCKVTQIQYSEVVSLD